MLDKDGDFNIQLKHGQPSDMPDGISIGEQSNGKFKLVALGMSGRQRTAVTLMLDIVEMEELQAGVGDLLKDSEVNQVTHVENLCHSIVDALKFSRYEPATGMTRELVKFITDRKCYDVLPKEVISAVSAYLQRGVGMDRSEQARCIEFVDKLRLRQDGKKDKWKKKKK